MKPVAALLAVVLVTAVPAWAFLLPDTDQRTCYQAVDPYGEIPCAGTGQDGAYLVNPLRYTDNGDGTVTDENTGLMWQQQDDGAAYTWGEATGAATSNPRGLNVCGNLRLGGYADWRLPLRGELLGIVDYGNDYPALAIDEDYFPNTRSWYYWCESAKETWLVAFTSGFAIPGPSHMENYVRCVRGAPADASDFTDNGDGTVTDRGTGLTWQQGNPGEMAWGDALAYCEGLELGGAADWRLPNVKELESLVDDTDMFADALLDTPIINTGFFPGASPDYYWSSTADTRGNEVWMAGFFSGMKIMHLNVPSLAAPGKGPYPVRCVRGEKAGSLHPPVLDPVGDRTLNEMQTLSFTLTGADPDGAAVTFSASNLPAGAVFDAAIATFTWTPGYDQAGTYSGIRLSISDGTLTETEEITITVLEGYFIRGVVRTSGGLPMRNVRVRLTPEGGTSVLVRTNGRGKYVFDGLAGYTEYTIRPRKAGWAFTPRRRVVYIGSSSRIRQNFRGSRP